MEISEIMRMVSQHESTIFDINNYRKYAVLLPLVDIQGEIHVLFEVRSFHLRSQPGDVCFPGGRIDSKDTSPLHCAIRETSEELGLGKQHIKQTLPLDYIVSDLGRVIYPFVGIITDLKEVIPNKAEVQEVFTVPLAYFMEHKPKQYKVDFHAVPEDNFPFHLITNGKDYDFRSYREHEPFYVYNDRVIWGLTAKILIHFISLIKRK